MEKTIKKGLTKIKEEQKIIAKQAQIKTIGYFITSLGVVVGLALNDAVKSVIEYIWPLASSSAVAKLIYALLLTIAVAVISVYLMRISERIEGKDEIEK